MGILTSCPATGSAEVTRLVVSQRVPLAAGHAFERSGPYEKITGRIYLEVDPADPANERIVDLKLAPRNDGGKVDFWTDFCLLAPADPSRGNRRLFYDVNNRGNKLALGAFNNQGGNDPTTLADTGNGFLMRQGYAILWCGWNGDVLEGAGRLQIGLPVARLPDGPITGKVYTEIVVDQPSESEPLVWGNSRPYPPVDPNEPEAALTKRPSRDEPATVVPRDEWAFGRLEDGRLVEDTGRLFVRDGFKPGWLYELVYTAQDPRVTGLGFAAVRDVVSFFRYDAADKNGAKNPLAGTIERAYVFGISQSGRFIHHFLYEDFNSDARNRLIFDGAMAHVGGAGRGLFNSRFAQTTRHGSHHEDNLAPSDVFPLTTTDSKDPVTGEQGSLLARSKQGGHLPKIFFTDTSTEYWARGASLLHTDVEGRRDVPIDESARLYFITGAQHGVTSLAARGIYENPINTLDHRPVLRALLVAMDRWVTDGVEPPASNYPRIDDGTLVDLETYRQSFPQISGVDPPDSFYRPLRLDMGSRWQDLRIADLAPPKTGPAYRTLVPAVDADGIERAGIKLPDVAVPLATCAGWNRRRAEFGAAGKLARWSGSGWPFAKTQSERMARGDSRRSIEERYPSRADYVYRFTQAALQLQSKGLLLDEDVVLLVRKAATRDWDANEP